MPQKVRKNGKKCEQFRGLDKKLEIYLYTFNTMLVRSKAVKILLYKMLYYFAVKNNQYFINIIVKYC